MLHQLNNQLIQQGIDLERNRIEENGRRLGALKERAITNNVPLTADYAIQLLQEIKLIARHDRIYRNHYGAQRTRNRRGNLGNLAITAKLFRDYANLIQYQFKQQYNAPQQLHGYQETNIFDDLAYLSSADIVAYDNPLNRPLYRITDDQVIAILDEICPVLIEVANVEIPAYNGNPPANLNQIRATYCDHRNLRNLFVLTSYHREITHLQSSIGAINHCITLHLGPPLLQGQIIAEKRVISRCLSIIGEAFTQVNLSPATRNLGYLSQQEFQLFKKIRDKLAHNEWDIHSNNIENFIHNNDMRPFIVELVFLGDQINLILQDLNQINNTNNLMAHYFHQLAPNNNPNNNNNRFPQVAAFLNNQPQDRNLYNQHRRVFPAKFTPLAMVEKINGEINEIIGLVQNAPGVDTLNDPHPENMQQFVDRQNQPAFMQLMMGINQQRNDHELNGAIQMLYQINPNLNGGLLVEIRSGIMLPQFDNQNHPQGQQFNLTHEFIQNNFDNLAEDLKRYSRKLLFIRFLQNNPTIKLDVEYHLGRLVKFLNEIPKNRLIALFWGEVQEPEIRVFRNTILHDIHETDLTGIPIEGFICHYLAPITQILPRLLEPLLQHEPQLAL